MANLTTTSREFLTFTVAFGIFLDNFAYSIVLPFIPSLVPDPKDVRLTSCFYDQLNRLASILNIIKIGWTDFIFFFNWINYKFDLIRSFK